MGLKEDEALQERLVNLKTIQEETQRDKWLKNNEQRISELVLKNQM